MSHPRVSQKRAKAISSSLFLVGLAILTFTGRWWPGIMLVIGIPLALRQFLLGKTYDMCLSLIIFVGAFIATGYEVSWEVVLPVMFITGAIYILFAEFWGPDHPDEAEDEESLSKEIEEDDTNQ